MDGHDSEYSISGGVFFSPVIQGHHISVMLPPRVTPAMAGLPAASSAFTGRSQDVDAVLRALGPRHAAEDGRGPAVDAAGARPVLVTAVGGMGGIGKTELALQAAHAALSRGWFAGGVLFADMFGYDPARRLTAAQAAAGFLRALGIPGEHIPADAQDLERLLRSVLHAYATQGRPVLMVIDNVSDHHQAAPLLPAHPACRAIVTSRHTLGLLDAHRIDLDILGTSDAVDLLDRAIQVAQPGDRRIADHPDDASQVAKACGGLPLALRITAALLADNPRKPLAAMASDLGDDASRLAELAYGDDALAAVFDLSYQALPTGQAQLFRLLSASPGPDIAIPAVAALTGLPKAETRRGLEALARAHLIEPGSGYGRWRMHDLIRLHSAHHGETHADADQRPEALARLLVHYLANTRAAVAHLEPDTGDPASLGFPSREEALAWLDAEYPNLTASTYAAAASPGHLTAARDLPAAMWRFLLWRRHFSDGITLSETALAAVEALQDRRGQVAALVRLGTILREVRRFKEAIAAHQDAAQIYRDTGDRHGEGVALNNIGLAFQGMRRFEEAITAHQDAVAIYRDTGDRHGEGRALTNLGLALGQVRRFDDAIAAHQQDLEICRELGARHSEGGALTNLGLALRQVRRFEDAITALLEAAQICRDAGDRHSEGVALSNLGLALQGAGRFEDAIAAHQQELQICRDLGDRHDEGRALDNLGCSLQRVHRFEEAVTALLEAAQIHRDTGDRDSQGRTLSNLGPALRQVQRFDEAIAALLEAVQICRDTGDRHGEGMALDNLGCSLQRVRRFEEAITAHQNAARIHRDTDDRAREGVALYNLGLALQGAGRFEGAVAAHQRELQICRDLRDHHGEGRALGHLGCSLRQVQRFDEAITALLKAARISRDTGDRRAECRALTNLGLALQGVGRVDEAKAALREAAQIYRDTRDQNDESSP